MRKLLALSKLGTEWCLFVAGPSYSENMKGPLPDISGETPADVEASLEEYDLGDITVGKVEALDSLVVAQVTFNDSLPKRFSVLPLSELNCGIFSAHVRDATCVFLAEILQRLPSPPQRPRRRA